MGLAASSDAGSLRNGDGWYVMPELMAEALRTQMTAPEPSRARRLQQQAMDVGDWDAAERLIVDDRDLASIWCIY